MLGNSWVGEQLAASQEGFSSMEFVSYADNIKMDLIEMGCEGEDWIQLAQYRIQLRDSVTAMKDLGFP
jgi:hypothetical protein